MEILNIANRIVEDNKLKIVSQDLNKPWGSFFVFDESDIQHFINLFFKELPQKIIFKTQGQKLSPKFLILLPNKRLSWQYHFRRSEIWKVIYGVAGVAKNLTDDETKVEAYMQGQVVILEKEQRHRLISFDEPCIVAEIWQHTDVNTPSDEDDIVRIQDDFGRY